MMVQTAAKMITFALFMIRELYCKLRTISGNFLQLQRLTDAIYSADAAEVIKKDPELTFFLPLLDEQIQCRKKAALKFPTLSEKKCLFASIPLEQATSEQVARAKSQFFGGETLLSLTGGLGADDIFLSENFQKVISIDSDPCLNELVKVNLQLLGISHIERQTDTAENHLAEYGGIADFIYIDPDRRASGERKITDISSFSPDVRSLYSHYRQKGRKWLIKLSPMTDFSWFSEQLKTDCTFYIFSHNNEIKEILAEPVSQNPGRILIEIRNNKTFILRDEGDFPEAAASDFTVFSEASHAVIKAGIQHRLAEAWKMEPVISNACYMTGSRMPDAAWARNYRLESIITGSLREMGRKLKELNITQAGISSRMFPLKPDEIRKSLKIKDGGNLQLFFCTRQNEKFCYVCSKI